MSKNQELSGSAQADITDNCAPVKKPAPVEGADRLLTDEEIVGIFIKHDTLLCKTPEMRRLWLEAVKKSGETQKAICKAQDAKTLSLLSTPQEGQAITREEIAKIILYLPDPDDVEDEAIDEKGLVDEAWASEAESYKNLALRKADSILALLSKPQEGLRIIQPLNPYLLPTHCMIDKAKIWNEGFDACRDSISLLPQGQSWQDKPDKAGEWWAYVPTFIGDKMVHRTVFDHGEGSPRLFLDDGETIISVESLIENYWQGSKWLFIPEPPAPKGETK